MGVLLFYLPYASRFFIGDDWLWLANGLKAYDNPSLFLERPIYGYFRPLSLLLVTIWLKLIGPNPIVFGTLNVILHAINVYLLYRVLTVLGADRNLGRLAACLFGFYYLNAPAVVWISSSGDLWVTTFSLIVIMLAYRQSEHPNWLRYALICLFGLGATLTKESGFVTFGLYYVVLLLNHRNPFSKEHRWYSISLAILGSTYIVLYFMGRTVVDKETVLGSDTIVNIWYFSAYTLLPLSKRLVTMIPESMHWLLVSLKGLITIGLPYLAWIGWRSNQQFIRLFIIWTIFFVATFSIFHWDISLFSLYPERTASRYMYSPNAGMMVIIAWVLLTIWQKWLINISYKKTLLTLALSLLIAGNGAIIYKVTQINRIRQAQQKKMYELLTEAINQSKPDRVVVLLDDTVDKSHLLGTDKFLKGMILVGSGRAIDISIVSDPRLITDEQTSAHNLSFRWDSKNNRLVKIKSVYDD